MMRSASGKSQVWFHPPRGIGKRTTCIAVAICMVLVLLMLLEQERDSTEVDGRCEYLPRSRGVKAKGSWLTITIDV